MLTTFWALSGVVGAAVVLACLWMFRSVGLRSLAADRDKRMPALLPPNAHWFVIDSPLSVAGAEYVLRELRREPRVAFNVALDLRWFASLNATTFDAMSPLLEALRQASYKVVLLGSDTVVRQTVLCSVAVPSNWTSVDSLEAAVAQLRYWHSE